MEPMVLDAALMRRVMIVYHDVLAQHRRRLNRLNVFPVPDADTGTNLTMTMKSVVEAIDAADEEASFGSVVASGALRGARGVSGVILSQILTALTATIDDSAVGDASSLAASLNDAADSAYAAVTRPAEGTILTVARAAAEAADVASRGSSSLAHAATAARNGAAAALARTPDLLPELRAAGVVDAGGAGFLLLLDALTHVVTGAPLPEALEDEGRPTSRDGSSEHPRFEVVVHLEGDPSRMPDFRTAWDRLGNESTVIVAAGGRWVAHTHTDDPDATTAVVGTAGLVVDVQITDLTAQVAEMADSDRDIVRSGVVAVVDGEGLRARYRSLGATTMVIGGPARTPSAAELLDAVERTDASEVIILPNDPTIVAEAEHVDNLTNIPVTVIPTPTALEGLAALAAYDGTRDGGTNRAAMAAAVAGMKSGSVVGAGIHRPGAHDPSREGAWLALTTDGLVAETRTPLEAAQRILAVLMRSIKTDGVDTTPVATVVAGAGADESVIAAIAQWAESQWPSLKFKSFDGGQLLCAYLIGVALGPKPTG
jgi:hypothetical protein